MTQETNPTIWGAQDRFQAHFVVRVHDDGNPSRYLARTIPRTRGRFGAKKLESVSWTGGALADALDADTDLNKIIASQTLHDAEIYVEPTDQGVRIYGRWKNHLDFGITSEMYDIYNKIAGHIKSL